MDFQEGSNNLNNILGQIPNNQYPTYQVPSSGVWILQYGGEFTRIQVTDGGTWHQRRQLQARNPALALIGFAISLPGISRLLDCTERFCTQYSHEQAKLR